MPRETNRKKSVRVDAPLRPTTEVRLQEQRRFFSSRGGNSGVREATALAEAFNVSLNFVSQTLDRRNTAGGERAVETAGAGGSRDVEDKNFGYNAVWDRLEDEKSLNFADSEITNMLREANAEDMPESGRQALISDFMSGQFKGIDLEDGDHTFLASGLLVLEAKVLLEYRELDIENIKMAQMSDTLELATVAFGKSFARDDAGRKIPGTGVVPYDDIMLRTNTFLEGSEKMTSFWEIIYDLAINEGAPNVILQVPEKFPSGDPTGINDPHRVAEHRAAIRSATVKQASTALERQIAQDEYWDDLRLGVQFDIFRTRQAGGDVSALQDTLLTIPGTSMTDITAATNFGNSQLSGLESRSANLSFGVDLWKDIHVGNVSASDLVSRIMDGGSQGMFGSGPQAADEMEKMFAAVKAIRSAGVSYRNADVSAWRNILNQRYSPKLGSLTDAINPVMNRINVDANSMYLDLIQNGQVPGEAVEKVFQKFDPLLEALPSINEEELKGRRSQADFTGKTSVSLDVINNVLDGKVSVFEAFAGVPTFVVEDRLMDEVDSGAINEAQAVEIAKQL